MYVNSDDTIMTVNRPRVLEALRAAQALSNRALELAVDNKKLDAQLAGGKANSPFRVLYRAPMAEASVNGGMADWVGTLMSLIHTGEHEQMRTLVEALGRCGSGELLALSPLLKSKPVAPQALQAQIVRGQAVGVDADADA